MKKAFFAVFLLAGMLLSAGEFNVKKFGAKGDGRTDDTAAIQAAVTAAAKRGRHFRKHGKHPQSSYFGTGQTVTFPAGVYNVSKTIHVGNHVSFSGKDATPMVRWTGPDDGIMFKINPFRSRFEKMIFTGGAVQLHFSNKNVDKTLITIRDCQFFYAEKIAVELTPEKGVDHLSSQTLIEGCLFSKNKRCVQNYGDLMEIRNCWVDQAQPQLADGAAFINRYGTLRFSFCCLTPSANPDKGPLYYHNARWVDNYDRFEAESVRFGAEGGGIPAVYNYAGPAKGHPWSQGGRVAIYNSLLGCGQLRRENGAVIRLFALPAQIVIENCYTMTAVPFIVCDPSLDVNAEIKKNPRGTARISYHIFNNKTANPAVNLVPSELKRFFRKESDCPFGKVVPRKIPEQVTGKRR